MSDMLLYTARVGHMFRVHGQIPLNDLFVEERTDNPTQYSFSIYSNNRYEEIIAKISCRLRFNFITILHSILLYILYVCIWLICGFQTIDSILIICLFFSRVITIAANSQEEKDKWLEDIAESVQAYKGERANIERPNIYLSLKSCSKIIILFIDILYYY